MTDENFNTTQNNPQNMDYFPFDYTTCRKFRPGHQVHWIQAKMMGGGYKKSKNMPLHPHWIDTEVVEAEGNYITLKLPTGNIRFWYHNAGNITRYAQMDNLKYGYTSDTDTPRDTFPAHFFNRSGFLTARITTGFCGGIYLAGMDNITPCDTPSNTQENS
ncbi:MAG: hypothetical protein CSA83_00070 [Actinomycetales bacterium]|nr:MAG: hypothetical protein CSA83_00070 [Actinomycetales bacterium]